GAADSLQCGGLGRDDADRPGAPIRLDLSVEVADHAVDGLREPSQPASVAAPQRDHLALDRIRVLGQLGGEIDDLPLEDVTEPCNRAKGNDYDDRHRSD